MAIDLKAIERKLKRKAERSDVEFRDQDKGRIILLLQLQVNQLRDRIEALERA